MTILTNAKPNIDCYICKCPAKHNPLMDAHVCQGCGKVWWVQKLKPTTGESQHIPGASAAMGGSKSGKNRSGKERMKRPTQKKMFDRLFSQT